MAGESSWEVVPATVGVVSRRWDEQHLDLQAAAGQIRDAGTSGFTAAVTGPARRFLTTWDRHATGLGNTCETTADGLRVAIEDYLATDRATEAEIGALDPYREEER
ncbi:hypothetical protein [Nocardioides sp. GXZ039]|uniref:hypothetical protein n=1 Tax=Nocardioides sp. GXZ039 TaxID=3136018 RepID=UPI0030F46AA4